MACVRQVKNDKGKMVPCGKESYPGAVMCVDHEIERLRESEASWKRACHDRERSLGYQTWSHYYRGANAEKEGNVYDPAFGEKFFGYRGAQQAQSRLCQTQTSAIAEAVAGTERGTPQEVG